MPRRHQGQSDSWRVAGYIESGERDIVGLDCFALACI